MLSSVIIFVSIIILLIIFQVILWNNRPPANEKKYKVVKAGDISSTTSLTVVANNLFEKKYSFNGVLVDPTDFEIFVVQGDSMSQNGIKTGDAVFIRKYTANEKYTIQDDPILLFEIDNQKDCICNEQTRLPEYKLRKFISYINNKDTFESQFEKLKSSHIEVIEQESIIKNKYIACVDKYKKNNTDNDDFLLIFSSTFDVDKNQVCYSFHPIKFLYGTVEYILPSEQVKIRV